MQDADLFMELAGIAGVFVGFGALIAVRSGGDSDPFEIAWMRGVVSIGLVAVLAALAPVVMSRYGLSEHEVWALSSILFLVGFVGVFFINNLSPEAQTRRIQSDGASRSPVSPSGCPPWPSSFSPRSPSRWAWHRRARRRSTSRRRAGPGLVRDGPPDAGLHGTTSGERVKDPSGLRAAATPGSTPAAPSSPRPPSTARSPGGASRSSATGRVGGRRPSRTRRRGLLRRQPLAVRRPWRPGPGPCRHASRLADGQPLIPALDRRSRRFTNARPTPVGRAKATLSGSASASPCA